MPLEKLVFYVDRELRPRLITFKKNKNMLTSKCVELTHPPFVGKAFECRAKVSFI